MDLGPASEGWHPRFSAVRRHYRYTVLNQALRSPLERRYAYQVEQPLCLDSLQAAAATLVGEHDFASFGRPMQDGETTVRCILSADWRQDSATPGRRFIFDVVGNAFLRSMVRALVAAQLQVGAGAWSVERLIAVLNARERALAAPPAPPWGLCLMQVEYVKRSKVNVRTYTATAKDAEESREWFVVDAAGKNLGRLATQIANVLKGKHKPIYTPGMDCGDFVIVINAEKVKVTGRKLDQKIYYRYSGYPSGLAEVSLREQLRDHPERVMQAAVQGMLNRNRLRRQLIKKLKVYAGGEHPHAAQQPKPFPLA